MADKVRDLLTGSLRLFGAVAEGETPSAAALNGALFAVNEMLDSWSLNNLMIHQKVREEFDLVPSQASYTMGAAGNFNTTRPVEIESAAYLRDSVETPVEVLTFEQWTELSMKQLTGTVPSHIFVQETAPLITILPWPIPTEANKLVLYSTKVITALTLDTLLSTLAPGYRMALRFNGAIAIASEYGKAVSLEVERNATRSLAAIQIRNSKPRFLKVDSALTQGRGANIFTGKK